MMVVCIKCDSESRKVLDKVKVELGLEVIYAATNAHVPQAECNNQTIKERVRSTYQQQVSADFLRSSADLLHGNIFCGVLLKPIALFLRE